MAALTLALVAALSPALLPHFGSMWDRTDSGTHIPLIGALSNPSVPAIPIKAKATYLAFHMSLSRYFPPPDAPDTAFARYEASQQAPEQAVDIVAEISAARSEIDRYDQAVAARERMLGYRRVVGSSLVLLVLVSVGILALRAYRLGHGRIGGLLAAGAMAFVPLAIPQVTNERVSVPVLSIMNRLPTRRVKIIGIKSDQEPQAPDGEVWSRASLEAARPVAVARIVEITADDQLEHWQMFDDDAVARKQLALAVAAAEAIILIAVWSTRRLSRWHPGFRSHFPTLWPKDRSRTDFTNSDQGLVSDVVSDSAA